MTLTRTYLIFVDFLNTDFNANINVIEEKIPSITRLATTSALNPVENKIPNVSELVKKTDCYTTI